jgi:DNA-binding response OmpR family regulator
MEGKHTILIVEDEKPLVRVLKLKLEEAGFEVQTAYNGKKALQSMQQDPADAVLLDLVMPEMDGFAVLGEMKRSWSGVPVIVMSNLDQPEDIAKAKSLGAKDFLIKTDVSVAEIVSYFNQLHWT